MTAEAGSQPTPSAPIWALARAISCSETCSHHPPMVSMTVAALRQLAGLPMRMAVARVSALTGA